MQDPELTDINAGTRNVDDRSTRTQQTGTAVDSTDLTRSQPPLELLEGSQKADVEQIDPSSKQRKKKKKKKKKKETESAISSTVDEDVQVSTPSTAVYSDRESSVSATTLNEASQQSTHLPAPIESENEGSTQCSHLPKKKNKKKKKKKKKTEMADSNLQGDDSSNGHFISSDAVTAIAMDAPVLADDGNEERTGNQEDLVMRKAISTTLTPSEVTHSEVPSEKGSLETNSSAENLDEIQEKGKRSATSNSEKSRESELPHAPADEPIASSLAGGTVSDGSITNPHDNIEAEKEEPESYNDNTSSDLEGRNIQCIFKLVYGVGLRALRKVFKEIHPSWSNKPADAAALKKGKMRLGKAEEGSFKKGNIEEWDFSLMTTVLLYSTRCELEVSKRPGHVTALRELKKCRNRLLGHPSSEMMSDEDFNYFWPLLSSNFIALGADPDDIAQLKLKSDKDLVVAEHYKQLFMAERYKHGYREKKLDSIEKKLDTIIANQPGCGTSDISDDLTMSDPKWDEWLRFRDGVSDFDTQKNQYILVADTVPNAEIGCYSSLRSVAWKMVLDFDPKSEEKGFYREFTTEEGKMSNLVSLFTPAELNQSTMKSLLRKIDPKKIQWLFVNGRAGDDGSCKAFSEWEASSVKDISSLFRCCSDPDTFDEQKPVVCLILPFSDHSRPFIQVTLSRLIENFGDKHNLSFVSVGNMNWSNMSKKLNVQAFDLSPKILDLGLKEILGTSTDQKLRMPTSHAGVLASLSAREYLYIKEYLDILYMGCENLPEDTSNASESQNLQENYLKEQRKSFLSGNEISFASLYDNHDAKREIERNIQIHVQRILDQGLTRPIIVKIRHSPGAGGTTVARRVLWDLHKEYPCGLIDISSHPYSDEDNILTNELADRIVSLEEICNTPPLILIDGKQSGAVEGISNKLTRSLQSRGKRALLLRCLRGSKDSSTEAHESSYDHVFHVNVKLEESLTDLNEFKSKYKEYLDTVDGTLVRKQVVPGLCRVFHFPLLSMMEEFRPKLKDIIEVTFNELDGIQQEIAVVVAFLQKYANYPTPAILLHEAFNQYLFLPDKKIATYDDIRALFSECLMNLMIPVKPSSFGSEKPSESYTFQHPLVADLVLKRVYRQQKRDLFGIVERFLQFPIYQQEKILPLVYELFIYNKIKEGQTEKLKFSLLFEELRASDTDRATEIFCNAAEKINHPVMYGNAARFCARKEPPSFPKAKDLIQRALEVHKSTSKGKYKNLCHTKGVVLYFELKYMINSGKVEDLQTLEEMAKKVLEAYREARNFPPTYPHPLIGEVEVWLECITWIMNSICNNDAEETMAFLTDLAPPFFRNCVSDSFRLLDFVDGIVQSVAQLTDPEETKRLSHNLRLSLMRTFPRKFLPLGRRKAGADIVQACRAICTAKNFRESSQLELKRLQAQFMLSSGESVHDLKKGNLEFLLKLLEDLVLQDGEYHFAQHLIKVCMLVTGRQSYSLERGLHICEKWLVVSGHDCLPDFYQMAICFLKVIDGCSLEFMPKYTQALDRCREKSQSHLRRPYATLFVGKEGQGMSRLISFKTLLLGESDYSTDNSEKVSRFWQFESRKKLLECKGRIRVKQSSRRGKSQPYIELLQGNLELYVGKNADIGEVERDFTPGALVYFVVSFNLQGPVANGIQFSPHNPSNDERDAHDR